MLTEKECDALIDSALSDADAVPALPAPHTPPAKSEPLAGEDSTVSEPDLDIPPLDPMLEPITHRRAELERLGERIAELSSRIQAATYDLLVLIREFDARSGWSGWTSCAHWLSWRTGLAPGPAREHVRVARALGNLPKLSDAMRRGAVSYSKVRAVTRVATPETEQALLDVAQCGTAAHVEQIVRGWRRVDRTAERTEEKLRQDRRSLRTWVDDDGMVVVQGRLTPEVGAALRRALEAACDQARSAAVGSGSADSEASDIALAEEELGPTFGQRQADAIGVIAECALAGGLDRGTAGDRYQVVVHVDSGALADERDVPAGTPECRLRAASDGEPTDVGEYVPAGTYKRAELASELDEHRQDVPAGTPPPASARPRRARRCWTRRAASMSRRRRRGGWPAMRRRSRCGTVRMARFWTLAAGRGPSRRRCGGRWRRATGGAAFRAVRTAAAMRTTLSTGRTAGRRRSTTWCCYAAGTTGRCTRRGSASRWTQRVTCTSRGRTGGRSPRPRRRRPGTGAALAPVTERLDEEGVEIDSQAAPPAWRGEQVDIGWAVGLLWKPRPDAPSAHTNS